MRGRRRHESVSAIRDRVVRVSREEGILLQNNGVRPQMFGATLKRSSRCHDVEIVQLTTNLRLLIEKVLLMKVDLLPS